MKFEFSAGGVVFKPIRQAQGKKDFVVLIGQHSQHHGWVFPKGLIGDTIKGEKKDATAMREVKEETGITGKIVHPLSPVTFWYVREKEKIKKTVYYFLMEYAEGTTDDHDLEMEKVEWIPIKDVEKRLTYKSDKSVWQEAKQLITTDK